MTTSLTDDTTGASDPGRRPRQTPAAASPRAVGTTTAALLRTARPRQWLKNSLVFAAPAAAGTVLVPVTAAAAAWAAVVFTLAAASTYFVNDARDVEADRRHPTKCRRPVAAGLVSPATAQRTGLLLGVGALLAAAPLGLPFLAVVVTYLALTLAYSTWLKHQPVLDVLAVALGFVLRAAAGAAATGVAMSSWFLLVALFGSLFLVTAKRSAEQARTTVDGGPARATVEQYPASWLQQILTLSLAGTVLTYATWALQYVGTDVALPLLAVSVVPFLAVMLRYSLLVADGGGEAPEGLLTSDRFMLLGGALWALTVAGALYAA